MKEYFRNKNGVLYQGECIEVMEQLIKQGVKVDAIICDPPYGIFGNGDNQGIDKNGNQRKRGGYKGTLSKEEERKQLIKTSVGRNTLYKNELKWDVAISFKDMWEKIKNIRRLKNNNIILFSNDNFALDLKISNRKEFNYTIIWNKMSTGIGIYAKHQPLKQYEEIIIFKGSYDNAFSNNNDREQNHPLREYGASTLKHINIKYNKTWKELIDNKTFNDGNIRCFFNLEIRKFLIPTKKEYEKLINLFKINELENFKTFEEITKIHNNWKKEQNIDLKEYHYNLYKASGKTKKELAKLFNVVQVGNKFLDKNNEKATTLRKLQPKEYEILENLINGKMKIIKYEKYLLLWTRVSSTYNPQMVKLENIKKEKTDFSRDKKTMNNNLKIIEKLKTHKYPTNIWQFKKVSSGAKHPMQKSLPLMEELVKTYTNENDVVLDFTCGSGTTLLACQNLKRQYIGIELSPKYCEIAKRRLQGKEKVKEKKTEDKIKDEKQITLDDIIK